MQLWLIPGNSSAFCTYQVQQVWTSWYEHIHSAALISVTVMKGFIFFLKWSKHRRQSWNLIALNKQLTDLKQDTWSSEFSGGPSRKVLKTLQKCCLENYCFSNCHETVSSSLMLYFYSLCAVYCDMSELVWCFKFPINPGENGWRGKKEKRCQRAIVLTQHKLREEHIEKVPGVETRLLFLRWISTNCKFPFFLPLTYYRIL